MNIISNKKTLKSSSSSTSTPSNNSKTIKNGHNTLITSTTPNKSIPRLNPPQTPPTRTSSKTPPSSLSSRTLTTNSTNPSSSTGNGEVYQVVKNVVLSSNERNTEQCTRAIQHFANGKFDMAIDDIGKQTTKSFFSKLLLYKSCYHTNDIRSALRVLRNLHNDATVMSERGEEDMIAVVQISLMISQVVLFKLIPKRLKLQCLLVEESTTTTEDVISNYLKQIVTLLDMGKENLKQLKIKWKEFEESEDALLDLISIIKQLNWFIVFFKGVTHLRKYEYKHSKDDYEEWKKILKKIYEKGEFLHVDFFYMYAYLSFVEGEFENALVFLNKAERSEEHCKNTMKEQIGSVNATDSMWLLDNSSLSYDVFDMIQDLKSKVTFSIYLEKRIVLRELEKDALHRLIQEIKSISTKRRQHNAKLVEQTQQFDDFLGTLAQTSFKRFDCSIIEKLRTYGQYRYVVHLAKKLLSDKETTLSDKLKTVCVHHLIEALYYMKRFSECVSIYCVHADLFKKIEQDQQRLVQVNYFVVDSFITVSLEGGPLALNTQQATQLLKENLKITKDSRQYYLGIRLYKLSSLDEVVSKFMEHLSTSLQNSSSNIIYEEFFSFVEQYSSRPFTIKIGASKSLTVTPNKTRSMMTPQKKSSPEMDSAIEFELATYSTFEDFSPHRLKDKMKKQSNALDELKRKREQLLAKDQSSKKVKLE